MKKLIAALVAGLFAVGAFAAEPATVNVPAASVHTVAMKHHVAKKKHHKVKHHRVAHKM